MRLSCVVAILSVASLAQAAEPAAKSDTVSGSFSVGGKEIKLASAAAFRDQDSRKQVVVVLSDKEVPASTWKNGSDMSAWRREHSFMGIAFWIDESNEIDRCEYYVGTPYPTSVSGIFDFKVERAPGVLSGSVKSNAGAARLRTPVKLDATFKVSLK
jgi:hypothetical protein